MTVLDSDCRYWYPDFLSVELKSWIPIVSGIQESLSWITDSKTRDSRFHKQNVPGFSVPKVKSFRIPESGILSMGEWHECRFCSLENVAFNILSFYLEFRYHASFRIIWCGVVLYQSLCQHFGIKLLKDIFVFNVLEHNHLHKQTDKTTIRDDKKSTHKAMLQQESTDYKWLKYKGWEPNNNIMLFGFPWCLGSPICTKALKRNLPTSGG